jgi:hypothetical protein
MHSSRSTASPRSLIVAKIVNGVVDTGNSLWNQPEVAGLNAIAVGFRPLDLKDDPEIIAAESIVYDALYGYGQEMAPRKAWRPVPLTGSDRVKVQGA